ncbi:MAG TPA: hypothetical protein VLL56_04445 [Terriglobia bacterium]|nr:hypothetical protein [Terriglobia bacterium]
MRTTLLVLLSIIFLPLCSLAQSTLNFPHVLEPPDFATSGIAIVNPGPTDAAATFTLFGADGSVVGTSTQTITARGQFAAVASQLFSPVLAGWVQVTSDTAGLQGFWFAGDLVNYADGAEAAPSGTELVLPMVAPSSEIDIANTGTTDVTIVMDLVGLDGLDQDLPFPQRIPAKGFFKANAATIFGKADFQVATHLRLKCGCTGNVFAGLLIAKDFIAQPSWAVMNALPASTSSVSVIFPHLVDGPQGNTNWKSVVGVTNLSAASSNDVTLVFTAADGTSRTAQRTIQPNGSIRETAQQLFGFTTGFQNGWLRITSTSSIPITGFVAYAEMVGAAVAVVPPQSEGQVNLLFAHIADLPPWWTGLALLNANPRTTANIEIFAMNPDGSLIGGPANVATARFSLPGGIKVSKLLSEWIPDTQRRKSDGGFIFVRSDLPIFGIELFFSRNMQILANVPPARIPAGSYVPPSPR